MAAMSADTAPAAMPGEVEVAQAIASFRKHITPASAFTPDILPSEMAQASAVLALFAPILAEKERRDAAIAKQAEFDAWLEDLAENPPPVSDALRKLYADYKASGIAAAIRAQGE